jgi:hypothetical protein
MLKEATDVFNEIFGWSTLLNIFYNSIRTLTLLDMFLRSEGPFRLSNEAGSVLGMKLQFSVNILPSIYFQGVTNVHLCDSILHEYAHFMSLVCKLEASSESGSFVNKK